MPCSRSFLQLDLFVYVFCELLLQKKAMVDAKDIHKRTARDYCATKAMATIIESRLKTHHAWDKTDETGTEFVDGLNNRKNELPFSMVEEDEIECTNPHNFRERPFLPIL